MSLTERTGVLAVSAEEFAGHCASGEVLVSKSGKPALLAHTGPDGMVCMTKIWRRRDLLSSDRLFPYAYRFRRALETLPRLDVPAPVYRAHGRVAGSGARFVIYRPLEGTILRDDYAAVDLDALAAFVCTLHDRGVYFRGLHLGNVVRCSNERLGLIDVQDIRFLRRPLGHRRRERNLGILCSHPGDLAFMLEGHWQMLVMSYSRAAGLPLAAAQRLGERVGRQIERRRARRAARRIRRGLEPLAVGEYGDTEDADRP